MSREPREQYNLWRRKSAGEPAGARRVSSGAQHAQHASGARRDASGEPAGAQHAQHASGEPAGSAGGVGRRRGHRRKRVGSVGMRREASASTPNLAGGLVGQIRQ